MHRNGTPTDDQPTVAKSFSRLAHDVIELSELQAQLLRLDAQNMSRQVRIGVAISVVALLLLLGCIPVVLLTLAEAFVTYFEWSRIAALAAASVGGIVLSGILAAAGWRSMSQGMASFQRSREELGRNITWLKSALKASSRKQASFHAEAQD